MSLLESTLDDTALGHEDFKVMLEDHLAVLSAKENIQSISDIVPMDAYRFEYDFFGLLRYLGIQPRYHWVVMRVNGLASPADYQRDKLSILIPNFDLVENLFSYFSTVVKRSAG